MLWLLQEEAPIRLMLGGPQQVRHDFSSGSVCTTALTLSLRNCLPCPASLLVELAPASDAPPGQGALQLTCLTRI